MAKRDRGGISTIRDALNDYLQASGLRSTNRHERVFDAWTQALGERMSRRARPVSFRSGELVCEVTSSAHLQELEGFTGEEYRRRANQALGEEAILRVVFKMRV